jgi:hypothetical protein
VDRLFLVGMLAMVLAVLVAPMLPVGIVAGAVYTGFGCSVAGLVALAGNVAEQREPLECPERKRLAEAVRFATTELQWVLNQEGGFAGCSAAELKMYIEVLQDCETGLQSTMDAFRSHLIEHQCAGQTEHRPLRHLSGIAGGLRGNQSP